MLLNQIIARVMNMRLTRSTKSNIVIITTNISVIGPLLQSFSKKSLASI